MGLAPKCDRAIEPHRINAVHLFTGAYMSDANQEFQLEIRRAFEADATRMGDVWTATAAGKTPDQIAQELGTQTSNFVNKYLRFARAIETGDLPSAPTMIRECKTTTEGFLRRNRSMFSDRTIGVLQERIAMLESLMHNPAAEEAEDQKIRKKTESIESEGISGIYVYTLPHYRKHPVEPSTEVLTDDRTLMKVGMSDSDVIRRFLSQQRTTSLPEDPELLRVYTGAGEMLPFEQRMHRLLRAADHRQNKGRASGTEWFLTSLKFLDALAFDMGLQTHMAVESLIEDGDQ
jgi:hypothetical protein